MTSLNSSKSRVGPLTGLYTVTSTHCGSGQAAGAIDLPIARESHTGLPFIPSTAVKGVLRARFEARRSEDASADADARRTLGAADARRLFGPGMDSEEGGGPSREAKVEEDDSGLFAGQLLFFDAMLLAFPVRSLTGVFRHVTSPLLLRRVKRLLAAVGHRLHPDFVIPEVDPDAARLAKASPGAVSLDDLVFPAARCAEDRDVKTIAEALAPLVARDPGSPDRVRFTEGFTLVHDDVLLDLCERTTPVNARIVLDPARKTSANLWYEETLPPECLFAVVVDERRSGPSSGLATLSAVAADEEFLRIGGNETVGQGIVRWVFRPDGVTVRTEGGS